MTAHPHPAAPEHEDAEDVAPTPLVLVHRAEDTEDGPPAAGVMLLLGAFMLGMYVGSLLWWLR